MLFGHDDDGPDAAGARGEPISVLRTRDQRTTVAKKKIKNREKDAFGDKRTGIDQNDACPDADDQPPASLIWKGGGKAEVRP
jgi:hypothetical protein